jgi:hypothetical protein
MLEIVLNFPNFIENLLNIRKIQSKFLYNPLEQISTIGLTKSLFENYFLLENSHK